jgi:SAM-dependent methyltransferase
MVTVTARRLVSTNAFGSSLPAALARGGWDGAWRESVTPWETRAGHRLLRPLALGEPRFGGALPPGNVLVAGAGTGRDAVELAKAFAAAAAAGVRAGLPAGAPPATARVVVGADLSPTAVARGEALVTADAEAAALARAGRLELRVADFFAEPARAPRFGALLDYLFLSALPPGDLRAQWADACARVLEPGGEVVAIVFPVDVDGEGAAARLGAGSSGPPFAMRPESLRELLLPRGFSESLLVPVPRELSIAPRAGREWLARYVKTERFPVVRVHGARARGPAGLVGGAAAAAAAAAGAH